MPPRLARGKSEISNVMQYVPIETSEYRETLASKMLKIRYKKKKKKKVLRHYGRAFPQKNK